MTKEQVRIDFEKALAAVAILEDAGETLHMADGIHQEYLEIQRYCWQGESAQRFQNVGMQVGEEWIKRRDQLLAIAEATRNAARRWYEAEMRAIEIIERRDYDVV